MTLKSYAYHEEENHYDNLEICDVHLADRSTVHHKMLKNNGKITNQHSEVSIF